MGDTKKVARPALFFEFRRAEWRYGLSLVQNILAPDSRMRRSLLGLATFGIHRKNFKKDFDLVSR